MAFCNSCGATLNPGVKFCNKCGAVVAAGASAPAPAPPIPAPPPAPKGGSSALKIILIIVAVIVGLGILSVATVSYITYRAVTLPYRVGKNIHVTQEGDHVKAETPFGTVESSKDPEQTAKDLGVDIYPGAEVQKNGASSATFMGIHTVTAIFESSDALDKVCSFYQSKFPNAMSTTSDQNHCTIVSNDQKNMITINIEADGSTTKIQITNVSKKASN